ncbi:MAG: diphthine synthase [Candidatus Thermoplasmatota archaeon]
MVANKLVFIGLGLYDEKDLSLRAYEELTKADTIYCEFYTSKLNGFNKNTYEKRIGKKITILPREQIEQGDMILQAAEQGTVCLLVGGDPMTATTHIELRLRAEKKKISTQIIHNSSIISAAPGLLGLQNYKFGRTTTLAFPEKNYFPTSPYTIVAENNKIGLHTLVLLDIQAEKNRYMTANDGLDILVELEHKMKQHVLSEDTLVCVVARAGAPDSLCAADTLHSLRSKDFGPPPHTLIIPGILHFMELEALQILAGLPAHLATKVQKQ